MKHFLLLLSMVSLFWLFPSNASATHVAGGEITYENIGGDTFLVNLTLYRDCNGVNMGNTSKSIRITSSCTGAQNLTVLLQNPNGTEVSQICPSQIGSSQCNGGTLPGMQAYYYTGQVILATNCSDYLFQYAIQNRNVSVNVLNSNVRFYVDATLNSTLYPNNSSPVYTAPPIPYVCLSQTVNYNYGVVENDGDSLAYTLVNARTSNGAMTSVTNLTYNTGYSGLAPIIGVSINSSTGELSFTPGTPVGNYIVVTRVTEYNGAGVAIATVERDIQFVVINCANQIPTTPTSASNLVNTTGTASFTDSLEITANVGDQFCFDVTFSDINLSDTLVVISNATAALPGATMTTSGTNPVTATVCWTVPPGMNTNNTVTFQVSDSACPVSGVNSLAFQIIIPPPTNLVGALTVTDISCNGLCDGAAVVVPSGGVGPYNYFWAPLGTACCQGLSSITGMCSGFYILVVTDLGDPDPSTNTWDTTFQVASTPPMAVLPPTVVDDGCTTSCTGSVSALAFGGTAPLTYSWSNGGGNSTITGLCAGTYTLTITDGNNCTGVVSADVLEPTPPTLAIDSIDSVTCFGGNDGVIYANAHPTCGVSTITCATPTSIQIGTGTGVNGSQAYPAPYGNWYWGAKHQILYTAAELTAAGVLPGVISSLAFDIATLGATINFVDYTLSLGCTSDGDLTGAAWQTGLVEVFSPKTHSVTVGWNTHDFDVDYYWDGVSNLVVEVCFNNSSWLNNGNSQTRFTPTTNQSVRYYRADNANVCGSNSLTATSTNRPNIRFGNCASTYTYAWSPSPATGQTVATAINLTAQTYILTVTANDGCVDTISATVEEPAIIDPTITLTAPVSCSGVCDASISVSAVGGQSPYVYTWNNGLAPGATQTNLCAGTYIVTVTDAKLCAILDTIVIVEPAIITATTTINTVISCNGVCDGNVTVSGAGGTAPLVVTWPGGLTGSTQGSLCTGTYDVTITDANSCFIVQTVNLTEPAVLTVSLTTVGSILCNGDNTVTINSTVAGGTTNYAYAWSNAATSANLTNVGAGTYTLTVTDAHGCTATDNVTLIDPPLLVGSIVQNGFILCNGDLTGSLLASAVGGTPIYGFAWSNSVTTALNANIAAGAYTVTITDANGCTDIKLFTINEPAPVLANLTITSQISCNGVCDGAATVAPSGGSVPYTVAWPAGVANTGNSATGLCGATNYVVTITDNNACQITETINLTEPTTLTSSITLVQGISCGGVCDAQITAVAAGGTPNFTYSWSNGSTSAGLTGLCFGSYSVTITDVNGCTSSSNINITQPNPVVASIAVAGSILCFGDQTVTLTASTTGGTPNYTYAWSNSVTGAVNANVGVGSYTVTVTDANGCTGTMTQVVGGPTAMVVSNTVNNMVSCNGVCDGSATINASGGTAGYTYAWPGGLTGATQNALCDGSYIVTVTDANACTETTTVVITEPVALNVVSVVNAQVSCNGVCDGNATISTSGGSAPITITWPSGSNNATETTLCDGTYIVTATDANGCSNTTTVIITEPNVLAVTLTQTGTILCNGDNTVNITSTVTGGTTNYSYLWSNLATSANLTNIGAGSYTVTVTDANSCTATATINVTEPAVLDVTIAQTGLISCGGAATASLLATGTGGTLAYGFAWSNSATTAAISNLAAGTYTVTITDANSCTDTASFIVTEPTPIVANPTILSAVSCNGVCDGSVSHTPTGGTVPYTIAWPAAVTVVGTTATGLCGATQYIVTITDANTCQIFDTVNLAEPTTVTVSINLDAGVSCGGICDAQVTATGAGGTGTFTYAWSNGITGGTINNLCAGTFTVTATDANGCTGTNQIIITQPNPVVTTIAQTGTVLCFGDSTITLTATTVGGTANYTYLWNTGATSATITNTGAGTYSVTTTDANSCSVVTPFTVTGPADIVLTANITNAISCNGVCDASAVVIAVGGTPGMTFTWPGGANGPSQSNLCAGDYIVTVTDANACSDTITVSIVEPNGIVIITNVTSQASCNGVCDGEVNITLTGGTAPLTIAWPSGGSAVTETGLCAGAHTVTVTDANGCSSTATIVITEPVAITLTLTQTGNISCNGVCDGVVSASGSGGTAPYIVVWPGNDTTSVKTGLCQGTYVVTVEDANGCTSTQSITVNEPAVLSVTTAITNAISCNGVCDGELTATIVGGTAPFTTTWSNGITTLVNGSLCIGSYSVTITDANGCTASAASITLTEPAPITANQNGINALCGVCNGSIILSGTAGGDGGPYTYNWSGGTQLPGIPNITIGLCPGTYTVTITDGSGCAVVLTETISNFGGPTSATFTSTNPTCAGGSDGSITVTPTGGTIPYTYLWASGGISSTETGLSAGIHSVTITDDNGCVLIATDTLVDPSGMTNVASITDATCNGVCDGTLVLTTSGGAGNYTYLWSNSATGNNLTALCAGSYSVITTDANNCTRNDTFIISEPIVVAINLGVTNAISCNGVCDGEMTATVSGGTAPYTITWSNGGIGTMAVGLCAGSYTATVVDANGCSQSATLAITAPSVISATLTPINATCGACDGQLAITNTAGGDGGPYIYAWSNSAVTPTITSLCPGSYTVTITDGAGCNVIISAPISNTGGPASATITKTNATCNSVCDGSINVSPLGGTTPYAYAWSSGGNLATETGLCAGIYTVTITDALGCVLITSDTITEPSAIINVDTLTHVSCNAVCDGMIALTTSGGTGPYTYAWSNSATGNTVSTLCAGTYTVTTTDASGCATINTYIITEPTAIVINLAITNAISCNGVCDGEITSTISGGSAPYTLSWSNASTSTIISGVCAGLYTITVTDANGCSDTSNLTLSEPAVISATVTPTNATCGVCDGAVAITNPTGGDGGPYTYAWSNGGSTATSITSLCPGTYTVTITDGSGCTVVLSSPVSNNGGPTGSTLASSNPSCNGVCDGSITVTPIGGTTPYSFAWSSGGGLATESGLCDGIYTVTITDAAGCVLIISDTLTEPTPITNIETTVQASCNGVCDGSISVVTSGGTSTYTYLWSTSDTGSFVGGLCAGAYSVTVTDANGCTQIESFTITEPAAIVLATTTVDANCFNVCDGSATVSASGGSAPISFIWSTGDVGATATNLCGSTAYTVTATDANGCSTIGTVNIGAPAAIIIDSVIVTNSSCGASDGSLEAVVSGGTPGYTYLWNSTVVGNPITGIPAGAYVLEVTDINGCMISSTIPLSDVGALSVALTTTDVPCDGSCLGTATATASGGTGPFNYSWSNGDITQTATALCAGQVIVTVTDAAGGCIAVDTVTINQSPGLIMNMTFTNNTNCGGVCDGTADANVSGSTGTVTYAWSNGGSTATLTGLCAGTYVVTATDPTGCSAIDSVTIFDDAPLALMIDAVTYATCLNSNDGGVQVTVTGGAIPYSFVWTSTNGFTSTNQNISLLLTGTYYLDVIDANGCIVSDSAVVNAITELSVSLDDRFVCDGADSVVLSPTVTGDNGTILYQWYNVGGGVIGNDSTLSVTKPNDTAYYVVEVVSAGCSALDTGFVAPGQIPDVDAGIGETIVVGQEVTLGGNPTTTWGGSTFEWTPGISLDDATIANPVAKPSETTLYQVEVTNIVGCKNVDTILITVVKKLAVISGFTPNGDDNNDTWVLPFIAKYPSAIVEVYNRWGQLMFQSKAGYKVPWDGTFEGQQVAIGTYYYVIDLKDGDFPDPLTGPVTIMR